MKNCKNIIRNKIIALSFSTLAILAAPAHSAGHFISGLQGNYPAYDLNDAYVFQSSKDGYTTFISSSNPSLPGASTSPAGVTFGDGGLYNLHISKDAEFETGMTFTFFFKEENVRVHNIGTPNADVGEKGRLLASGMVGETIALPNGIRIWTGRGDDPFFGNGIGLAKFNGARQKGEFTPDAFKDDGDLFADGTASFIVVDVPNRMLGEQIKFFTTTAVIHKGEWKQVDRLANVLFPYVFFADTPAVMEDHEQHRPDLDVKERRQAIVNNVFWAVSVSGAKEDGEKDYANKIADMIMPDVITYKPGTKASYTVGTLNGRPLQDDAMNTVLQLMHGVAIDDNADDGKRYVTQFPYINSAN